jgi:tetratricopeptide (TPR) repeat protein
LELIDPEAALVALEKTPASQKQDDAWMTLARWVLAEAGTRTISPFSAMRVSDYVERGIRSEEGGDLEKAQLAAPDNALVHARLGLRHLGQEDELDAKAKVLADRETLLAIKLDPGSVEAWNARARVLKALNRLAEAAVAAKMAAELSKQ